MKLKLSEKYAYREMLAQQQGWVCPLCEKELTEGNITLDHDHGTGHCRMALCRNCNSIEGRVLHWVSRTGVQASTWLTNLMVYWSKDWTDNPLYPTHKNYIEKEIAKLRKLKKKVKLNKTKQKYQVKIERLQKQLLKEDRSDEQNGKSYTKRANSKPMTRSKRSKS